MRGESPQGTAQADTGAGSPNGREGPPSTGSTQAPKRAREPSDAFSRLQRAHRGLVWPLSILFVGTYLLTVWLAAYRAEWMAGPGAGPLSVGCIVVLMNFALSFAATLLYCAYANRRLDPLAAEARLFIAEGGEPITAAVSTGGEPR